MPSLNLIASTSCGPNGGKITGNWSGVSVQDATVTIFGTSTNFTGQQTYAAVSNGSFEFGQLQNDLYEITVDGTLEGSRTIERIITCTPVGPVNDLALHASGLNPTSNGVADGQVNLTVTTSNQPWKSRLNGGAFTNNLSQYTGLSGGSYTVEVQDAAGFIQQATVALVDPAPPVYGCMDSKATNYNPLATEDNDTCEYPRPAALFSVPMLNSLRFVTEVSPNNCSTFATIDNQLFCKTKNGNYNPGYYQKVANCDVLTFQFRSNYGSNVIRLFDHDTGNPVGPVLIPDLKVAKVSAWEFVLDCTSLPAGRYYLSIAATDLDYPGVTAVSEPFWVKASHKNTHLITYRHSGNKFDMVYGTGIEQKVRVESLFYKRRPTGETAVMRNCNNDLVLLASNAQRRVLLETFLLPDWLHEKLSVVFRHDQISINGVPFQTEENYEFDYMVRYALSNGSVLLEQKGWVGNNINSEIEGGSNSGYLLVNTGYLEVTI